MNRLFLGFGISLLLVLIYLYVSYKFTRTCSVLRRIPTPDGMVELVGPDCLEGLPHTTDGNTIRMTESVWNSGRRDEIMIHERVHLDQKRNPEAWTRFYKTAWGYDLEKGAPSGLRTVLRPNPDTADSPYAVWRSRYVFFVEATPDQRLRTAPVRVWDKTQGALCTAPPEWNAFFCDGHGCPHQWEHPHELAAEYLTLGSEAPAARALRQWRNSLRTS